ncbi:DNA-binding response OmpR family regulator [Isoptericola sp. CG 20/1183]|uniref:DNA-binding response OmpR family regulator n=1 Tax=Isoptericola halotolerans TaxID=300560 RepID=A0ABX5EBA3_9MICO|nr:DNA-binding response OmpR family regulator [Isoptericola halotolerans]PRZ05288.1 DNA-binding response OmpR family regulator [Isoptericola sp. CG 20/1183]
MVRILVVEDEAVLARALRRGLQAEGFAVDVAPDGETGLRLALEGDHDVVVLDLMLPRRSGIDVLRTMRHEEVWTPVLVLSARGTDDDVTHGLDVGADDYLPKPFAFSVLVARLRALLRRGAPPRPAVLQVGTLTLDPASREVRQDGRDVELTTRETALLEQLMRRPGEVLTKIELRDHVWDAVGDDLNVVEVYVSYLRRKLGREAIETVRGVGYRVVGR